MVNYSIVFVESVRHGFCHTRLQSPAFKKFADLSNINVGGGDEIFKLACVVGKADVIGINKFPTRCGWQIIDVQNKTVISKGAFPNFIFFDKN